MIFLRRMTDPSRTVTLLTNKTSLLCEPVRCCMLSLRSCRRRRRKAQVEAVERRFASVHVRECASAREIDCAGARARECASARVPEFESEGE